MELEEAPEPWARRFPDLLTSWDENVAGWFIREQADGYVVHVVPMLFTTAILVSARRGAATYVDRWCYASVEAALTAAQEWEAPYPGSEPSGWNRHPITGRRRLDGDANREYIER